MCISTLYEKFLKKTLFLLAIFGLNMSHGQEKIIYIYSDVGTCENSFKHIRQTFERSSAKSYTIQLITAPEIIEGSWVDHAVLIIIPGGADLPYAEKLNGKGNAVIKAYVENGGNYLGFCAGAYYGSGFVEFDRGGPLEVLGERELSFFPGKCIGPILAPYDYQSNRGARAAKIESPFLESSTFFTYYNGGGFFLTPEEYQNVEVIGIYGDLKKPAILKIDYGKGKVILSAIHFEYSYQLLDRNDEDLHTIIPTLKDYEQSRTEFFNRLLETFAL